MNLFIFLFALALFNLSLAGDFSYKDTHSWARHWPACGGRRQSPIDINMSIADYSHQDSKIKFHDYELVPRTMRLINIGHGVKITLQWDDLVPTVSGGVLTGSYRLDSIYFHWNTKGIGGSEHTLNGTRAAMEMHSIHFNTNYRSAEEASHHDDGYAILADILFVEPLADISDQSPSLHQLFDQFPQVPHLGSTVNVEHRFSVLSVVPRMENNFTWIAYPGSMTVPPCTENVMWIVNMFYHSMDNAQLQRIQNTVRFSHHDDHNFRDIQELNGRKQYVTYTESSLHV